MARAANGPSHGSTDVHDPGSEHGAVQQLPEGFRGDAGEDMHCHDQEFGLHDQIQLRIPGCRCGRHVEADEHSPEQDEDSEWLRLRTEDVSRDCSQVRQDGAGDQESVLGALGAELLAHGHERQHAEVLGHG